MTIPGSTGSIRIGPLPRFVTVKGGAYLFMPSVTALRFLASGSFV
jgi:putative iron-dependent peroxidase